jgi:hypothetical protein
MPRACTHIYAAETKRLELLPMSICLNKAKCLIGYSFEFRSNNLPFRPIAGRIRMFRIREHSTDCMFRHNHNESMTDNYRNCTIMRAISDACSETDLNTI